MEQKPLHRVEGGVRFGQPKLTLQDVEIGDLIHAGKTRNIYLGRIGGKRVAVKTPASKIKDDEDIRAWEREIGILGRSFHPNVILMLGSSHCKGERIIVTEYLPLTLADVLTATKALPIIDRLKIARDLASALLWLHDVARVCGCRLQPKDILFSPEQSRAVIGNLRDCTHIDSFTGTDGLQRFTDRSHQASTGKDVAEFGRLLSWLLLIQPPVTQQSIDLVCKVVNNCQTLEITDTQMRNASGPASTLAEAIRCFESAMLHELIPDDPAARNAWSVHVCHEQGFEERVTWECFERALVSSRGGDRPHPLALRELELELTVRLPVGLEVVDVCRFRAFCRRFGNIFGNGALANAALVDMALLRREHTWYHGDVSPFQAAARLRNRKRGSFLVRASETDGQFPFELCIAGEPVQRIKRVSNGFMLHPPGIYEHWHPTLVDLINNKLCENRLTNALIPLTKECEAKLSKCSSDGYLSE